jgi:DnaJ-class molecular chaperone
MPRVHSHYENLRVARNAPPEVIRAAYKALSQRFHPDRNPGDPEAARVMALLNVAYQTLSDPQLRAEHDDWLKLQEQSDDSESPRSPGWGHSDANPPKLSVTPCIRQTDAA